MFSCCYYQLIVIYLFFIFLVSEKQYDSRLLHGKHDDGGIVQIRSSTTDEWSFINPAHWSTLNSHVVCRQLGYQFAISQSAGQWQFPEDSSPVLGVRFLCSGMEYRLADCDVAEMLQSGGIQNDMLAIQCHGNG